MSDLLVKINDDLVSSLSSSLLSVSSLSPLSLSPLIV